jgi:hypothetical protein
MKARTLFHTLAALSLLWLPAAVAPAAGAASSSEIAAETARLVQEQGHVANFWWLPPEYWILAAKELELTDAEQATVAKVFRDYTIIAALDADVSGKKAPDLASIADVVKRAHFTRGGETLEVLREVNPDVSKLVPTLVYLLRSSMGQLGAGLRLLPLANLDAKGNPVLTAETHGELVLDYKLRDDGPAHQVRWHAPLTAVVGQHKCPKGGEPLEASWAYCPWHGVKVEESPKR